MNDLHIAKLRKLRQELTQLLFGQYQQVLVPADDGEESGIPSAFSKLLYAIDRELEGDK